MSAIITDGIARTVTHMQAWIQNASLKDNILFGEEFDQARYNEVSAATIATLNHAGSSRAACRRFVCAA